MTWQLNWQADPAQKVPAFRLPAALGGDPSVPMANWKGLIHQYTGLGHERIINSIDSGNSAGQQLGRQFLAGLQNTAAFAAQRQASAAAAAGAPGPAQTAGQAGVAQERPGGFLNRITAAAGGGGPEVAQQAAEMRPVAPPPPPPPIVIQQQPQWEQAAQHAGMARNNWMQIEQMREAGEQQIEMIRAQAQERIATIQAMGPGGGQQVVPAGIAAPEAHVPAPAVSAGGAAAVQSPQEAFGATGAAFNQRAVEAIEQVQDATTRTRWFSGAHQILAEAGHATSVQDIGRHAILNAPDGHGANAVIQAFGHINVQDAAKAGQVTDEAGAAKVFASATTGLAKVLGMVR